MEGKIKNADKQKNICLPAYSAWQTNVGPVLVFLQPGTRLKRSGNWVKKGCGANRKKYEQRIHLLSYGYLLRHKDYTYQYKNIPKKNNAARQ
jgi:hypothetical protein